MSAKTSAIKKTETDEVVEPAEPASNQQDDQGERQVEQGERQVEQGERDEQGQSDQEIFNDPNTTTPHD